MTLDDAIIWIADVFAVRCYDPVCECAFFDRPIFLWPVGRLNLSRMKTPLLLANRRTALQCMPQNQATAVRTMFSFF